MGYFNKCDKKRFSSRKDAKTYAKRRGWDRYCKGGVDWRKASVYRCPVCTESIGMAVFHTTSASAESKAFFTMMKYKESEA